LKTSGGIERVANDGINYGSGTDERQKMHVIQICLYLYGVMTSMTKAVKLIFDHLGLLLVGYDSILLTAPNFPKNLYEYGSHWWDFEKRTDRDLSTDMTYIISQIDFNQNGREARANTRNNTEDNDDRGRDRDRGDLGFGIDNEENEGDGENNNFLDQTYRQTLTEAKHKPFWNCIHIAYQCLIWTLYHNDDAFGMELPKDKEFIRKTIKLLEITDSRNLNPTETEERRSGCDHLRREERRPDAENVGEAHLYTCTGGHRVGGTRKGAKSSLIRTFAEQI